MTLQMFTLLYNNEIIKYNIYRNEHDVDTIWSPKIPLELSLFGEPRFINQRRATLSENKLISAELELLPQLTLPINYGYIYN